MSPREDANEVNEVVEIQVNKKILIYYCIEKNRILE